MKNGKSTDIHVHFIKPRMCEILLRVLRYHFLCCASFTATNTQKTVKSRNGWTKKVYAHDNRDMKAKSSFFVWQQQQQFISKIYHCQQLRFFTFSFVAVVKEQIKHQTLTKMDTFPLDNTKTVVSNGFLIFFWDFYCSNEFIFWQFSELSIIEFIVVKG